MSRFPQYSASERSCQSQIVGNGTSDLPLRLQQVREQVRRVPSDKVLLGCIKANWRHLFGTLNLKPLNHAYPKLIWRGLQSVDYYWEDHGT